MKIIALGPHSPGKVTCHELNAEWTSTIETTTQLPVPLGTVVEVTCSDSGALNKGSGEVTCKSFNDFTYLKEPFCLRPGINIIRLLFKYFINNRNP